MFAVGCDALKSSVNAGWNARGDFCVFLPTNTLTKTLGWNGNGPVQNKTKGGNNITKNKWLTRREKGRKEVKIKAWSMLWKAVSSNLNASWVIVWGIKCVLWISPGGTEEPVGTEMNMTLFCTARWEHQNIPASLSQSSSAVSHNCKHFLQGLHSQLTWKWRTERAYCRIAEAPFTPPAS